MKTKDTKKHKCKQEMELVYTKMEINEPWYFTHAWGKVWVKQLGDLDNDYWMLFEKQQARKEIHEKRNEVHDMQEYPF